MTVAELIQFLQKAPRDALVVVNNEVVAGAQIVNGRVVDAYIREFQRSAKGKHKAVVFLKHMEFSDGKWGLFAI